VFPTDRPAASLALIVLASSLSAQQLARGPAPVQPRGTPIVAPRYLDGLQSPVTNGGVRASGDVDGDGDVDLLEFRREESPFYPLGMQTWLNDGAGEFALAHELAFDVSPANDSFFDIARLVALADVTGDAVLDLVYERRDATQPNWWNHVGPSGVLVHPGLGDGSFAPAILIDTGGIASYFVVGDCDGDGDDDILIQQSNSGTTFQNQLVWWRYQGGTFVAGAPLVVDADVPLHLTAFDVDGDDITDAVAGTFGGYDTLQVFRTVNGVPTLHASIPLPAEVHNINQRLRTGDIDGDGDEDVLLTFDAYSWNGPFYLLPILHRPSGLHVEPLQPQPNANIEQVISREGVLADWDEDGDLDYVSPTFSWMENTGGAHFELAGQQHSAAASWQSQLQITDLDGDGHVDAIADWMLVTGDGTIPRTASMPEWNDALNYTWAQMEDWEGDGDLDLVSPYSLLLNDGSGTSQVRFTNPPFTGEQFDLVGWGDFDSDGFRDQVGAAFVFEFPSPPVFVGMRFFAGDDSGGYHATAVVPSPIEMTVDGSLAGDIDGDGDEDILTRNGFWENDGSTAFGTATVAAYTGLPLLALDVDGDTDLDVLVARGTQLELLENQGAASFVVQSVGFWATGLLPRFLDVDEDGDLDLVTTRMDHDGVGVHEHLANGTFAPRFVLEAPATSGPPGTMDVNGDGRLDLVFARQGHGFYSPSSNTPLLSAWLRGPGLTFTERVEWVVREAPLAYGDLDGDGDVDAIQHYRVENLQFYGPAAGSAVQYALDAATPGSGGVHPVLGVVGPLRPGGSGTLAIGRGLGGAAGQILLGRERADTLVGGVRILVDPQTVFRSFLLGGPAGVAGAGAARLHVPMSAGLVGETFTCQALLVDPGASAGVSATNGVELQIGAWTPTVEHRP
jgi:hypothetical protein